MYSVIKGLDRVRRGLARGEADEAHLALPARLVRVPDDVTPHNLDTYLITVVTMASSHCPDDVITTPCEGPYNKVLIIILY